MIVLFTGMARSGSTWAYNVARVILLARTPAIFGEYRHDIETALAQAPPGIEHHLIKSHAPDASGRAMIAQGRCRTICTYRDPLDCIASQMEAFGAPFEETLAAVHDGLELLRFQAAAGGVLFVDYDELTGRPAGTVAAIARHLGRAVEPADAELIAERFSRDNVVAFTDRLKADAAGRIGSSEAWDSITLFHSRHIRAQPSAPDALLSAAQLAQARDRLAAFIDARGRLSGTLLASLAPRA